MNDPKTNQGNYPGLEQLSTQELEELLRRDFAAGEGNSDTDLVMAIMEVIAQRRTPTVDTDAAWETFRTKYIDPQEAAAASLPPEEAPEAEPTVVPLPPQKPPKKRRLRRVLPIAAVVCILVAALAIPAYGSGKLQAWIQWDTDTFSFLSKKDSALFDNPEYTKLENFVAEYTDLPILPTWYPEGTTIIQADEFSSLDEHSIDAVFDLNGSSFVFSVTIYGTIPENPTNLYEKNDSAPEEYYVNHIPHYIFDNMERTGAAWWNGNAECSIVGSLTRDELKQMLASIYE